MSKVFYVQHLPKGAQQMNDRRIVYVCSRSSLTLKELKDEEPEVFRNEGLYSLLEVKEQLEVTKKKNG